MKKEMLILAIVTAVIIAFFLGNFNKDTRILFTQTSYVPPEIVEEPIKGDAKRIVEILESQTELIEINEVYCGGYAIIVKADDGSSVHYNVFSDKICRGVCDINNTVIEVKWYKFTEEEFTEIQSLIKKLPKHKG